MSSARYAIYIAPPPEMPLWHFGSRVLGFDAVTGEDLYGFSPKDIDSKVWRELTRRARNYGFHATLKAPFRLTEDATLARLTSELETYCNAQQAFDLGPLSVKALTVQDETGFVALTPMRPSKALSILEKDVVERFDNFRAPLTEDEKQKRKPQFLTARQREALDRFGYPYIGQDYRFHMTLSDEIPNIATVADMIADAMANEIGTAHLKVDALVLFEQKDPTQRFRALRRFGLNGVSSRLTAIV